MVEDVKKYLFGFYDFTIVNALYKMDNGMTRNCSACEK
jgi:hypothetical protein